METAQPTTKVKPTGRGRLSLVFSTALLIILFFGLDILIGAVGLRAYYTVAAFLTLAIFSILAVALLVNWEIIRSNGWGIIAVSIALLLASLIICKVDLQSLPLFIIPAGWVARILTVWLYMSPRITALVVLSLGALWIILLRIPASPRILKNVVFFTCLFTITVVLGTAFAPQNFEQHFLGSLGVDNHHYFLIVYHGWLGDSDTLVLYQCNSLAISCETIFTSRLPYMTTTGVTLESAPDGENVVVTVGGAIRYTGPVEIPSNGVDNTVENN